MSAETGSCENGFGKATDTMRRRVRERNSPLNATEVLCIRYFSTEARREVTRMLGSITSRRDSAVLGAKYRCEVPGTKYGGLVLATKFAVH